MSAVDWLFLIIGLLLLTGLLWQFRLLTGRGLLAALGMLAAALGIAVFTERRRRRVLKEILAREKQLRSQEEELKRLEQEHAASEREIQKLQSELNRQRAALARRYLLIEAERQKRLREARRRIDNLTVPELLDEYRRILSETGG